MVCPAPKSASWFMKAENAMLPSIARKYLPKYINWAVFLHSKLRELE
jgi:hypothetical protein